MSVTAVTAGATPAHTKRYSSIIWTPFTAVLCAFIILRTAAGGYGSSVPFRVFLNFSFFILAPLHQHPRTVFLLNFRDRMGFLKKRTVPALTRVCHMISYEVPVPLLLFFFLFVLTVRHYFFFLCISYDVLSHVVSVVLSLRLFGV